MPHFIALKMLTYSSNTYCVMRPIIFTNNPVSDYISYFHGFQKSEYGTSWLIFFFSIIIIIAQSSSKAGRLVQVFHSSRRSCNIQNIVCSHSILSLILSLWLILSSIFSRIIVSLFFSSYWSSLLIWKAVYFWLKYTCQLSFKFSFQQPSQGI